MGYTVLGERVGYTALKEGVGYTGLGGGAVGYAALDDTVGYTVLSAGTLATMHRTQSNSIAFRTQCRQNQYYFVRQCSNEKTYLQHSAKGRRGCCEALRIKKQKLKKNAKLSRKQYIKLACGCETCSTLRSVAEGGAKHSASS